MRELVRHQAFAQYLQLRLCIGGSARGDLGLLF
jgi:hypothetical protein